MIRPANKIGQQPGEDIVFRSSDFSMSGRVPLTIRLRPTLVLLVLIVVLSIAHSGAAQGVKFTAPVTYPAGAPYVIAAGDFNRDGKMDLAGGDVDHSNLIMLLGNGDGTLKPAVTYHLDAAPYEIIVADFNRDGRPDLATANSTPSTSIGIFFGKGDGSFESPIKYPVSGRHMLAADFNRDGWLDIAVPTSNGVNLLLGSGKGAFQNPKSYSLSQLPMLLAAGDFNGDGKLDLVGVLRGSNILVRTIIVLLGNGDGTFRPAMSASGDWGRGSGPYYIAVGDFDRDGRLDLLVTDEYLTLLKGNGDATFKTPSTYYSLHQTSADLKVADFNGDGRLDLVSAGVFGGGPKILLGNGDGTFQDLGNLTDRDSVSIVVTDLNGDTRPDLAGNIGVQLALNVTPGNPDNTDYFVHQHYVDFLDREPDAGGFDYWANQIISCGATASCINEKRTNVSAAFLLSSEFQQTAGLVERLYKTAFGDTGGTSTIGGTHEISVPIVRLNEFLPDTQQIGQDVVVGQAGWDAVLENNKQSFFGQFVQRPRFTTAFPTALTPAEFVDRLNQNAGNVLSSNERAAAIALFGSAVDTSSLTARAQALRQVSENQNLYNAEFNRAFVLMEYFGYLRRNPNDPPDKDFSGYDFWLNKLNAFNGDYLRGEMVNAFIDSTEYRQRFGP